MTLAEFFIVYWIIGSTAAMILAFACDWNAIGSVSAGAICGFLAATFVALAQ